MTALAAIYRPGLTYGLRPERRDQAGVSDTDRFLARSLDRTFRPKLTFRRFRRQQKRIARLEATLPLPGSTDWLAHLDRLRADLRRGGLTEPVALECFAAICHAAEHTLGLKPHPVQRFGGWVMLHGALAEMRTGEGKTLTAALPAITMALAGAPVHVVTVNDYLVERDAAKLAPLYACFGLEVATITEALSEAERRLAYASDIVYCSNKQLVFDYLRDLQIVRGRRYGLKSQLASLLTEEDREPVMRGLCFAIVDEADSVLVDEARTPLILAAPRPDARDSVAEAAVALGIARALHQDVDFLVDRASSSIRLTAAGLAAIRQYTEKLSGVWRFERYRSEFVRQALRAQHLLRKDRDYLVSDGKIVLVDEQTGRLMADRKLQHGLHRLLEVKEKCEVTEDNQVIAALSFQQFFVRYGALAGMSGTVREVRGELARVYGLDVVPVPPHQKCRQRQLPTRTFRTREAQLGCLIDDVRQRHQRGQPVLVGARSVSVSELVSDRLAVAGLPNRLLNARQDSEEAAVVARAGERGAITVATNMAGRGTDIPLGDGTAELGGLHVINVEVNESRRVDRQLFGRAARQGDPGSGQSILYLRDELVDQALPKPVAAVLGFVATRLGRPGRLLASAGIRGAQARVEASQAQLRNNVRRYYATVRRQLSFAGEME